MKNHYSVAIAGICAGAFCLAANAQSNQPNPGPTTVVAPPLSYTVATPPPNYYSYSPRVYVGADLGGTVVQDTKLLEFFGPIGNTKVKFDPGVHVGFTGGYQLTDWFSVEGETGVYANEINSITGASFDGGEGLENVPFLANVRLQLPPNNRCRVTPYIGGGLGGSASIIDFDHHIDLNGVSGRGTDADVVFAYQAFAGLRYAITENIGIGVEYHYFVTTGPTWSFNSFNTATDSIKFGGTQTHAASIAFDFRF
jgi:opacity protein-like surface antigen